MIWSSRFCRRRVSGACAERERGGAKTHLEALVLEHALDGGILTTGRQLGLEDYTKGAVADNLALRVCEVLVVARQAILDLFVDNFCRGLVSRTAIDRGGGTRATAYHPFLARRRPMAGSGSLFGVMRRRGGPQAVRGLLSGVGRAVAEQGVAGRARTVEDSRSGWGRERERE